MADERVGYLVPFKEGYRVVCNDCARDKTIRLTPIYHSNIYPYKQTCMYCKKLIVNGHTDMWPELFTGRG